MATTDEQLFVITASNQEAQRHVAKSIAQGIEPAFSSDHFDQATLAAVTQSSADGRFYAWGVVPGPKNESTWNAIRPGDHVLVYQQGRYTYSTRVISKHRNAAFAEGLWGRDPHGQTWEFMYFL